MYRKLLFETALNYSILVTSSEFPLSLLCFDSFWLSQRQDIWEARGRVWMCLNVWSSGVWSPKNRICSFFGISHEIKMCRCSLPKCKRNCLSVGCLCIFVELSQSKKIKQFLQQFYVLSICVGTNINQADSCYPSGIMATATFLPINVSEMAFCAQKDQTTWRIFAMCYC